jgi:hypothetical protein
MPYDWRSAVGFVDGGNLTVKLFFDSLVRMIQMMIVEDRLMEFWVM